MKPQDQQPEGDAAPPREIQGPVLVTGATGYIGGRLVPRLLDAGYSVRCLARAPRKLSHRPWADDERVEVVQGDASNEGEMRAALEGCSAAFYLIHSMVVAGSEYTERDRELAQVFADAAAATGLGRIVYLGGLGETGEGLSEHLSSRREVEAVLASTGVPVTVLRAAMIIGSGSASFEILRYLVERLPIMVTPRWVRTRCQPIAIRDVLHYLVTCLSTPETTGRTLDIGGPGVLEYRELMQVMAEARNLPPRRIVSVPILTPALSSLWIHLVTPLSRDIARPLAEGLRNEVVCRNDDVLELMPRELLTVREAIDLAVENQRVARVETRWSDSGPMPGDPDWSGGSVFVDRWRVQVRATREEAFRAICLVGGGHGYYAADWLWRLRGWMDQLVGGPGLRRGRRDPVRIEYGEALDFWRVTSIDRPRELVLRAEMKLPGEARLDFEVQEGATPDSCTIVQTARFVPRGLLGLAYWYAVVPLHHVVFRGMLNGIRRKAEAGRDDPIARPAPVERVLG